MNSKNFTSESEWIATAIKYIEEIDPKTVALCGGQTAQPIYQALAKTPLVKTAHFFQTDERFVPKDHPESNQKMIREILKPKHFTTFNTDLEIPEALTDYAKKIPQQFDLIILSLGPDGHIASIFPDTPQTEEPVAHTLAPTQETFKNAEMQGNDDRLPEPYQNVRRQRREEVDTADHIFQSFPIKDRLTLTIPTILQAKHILLLAKNRDATLKRLETDQLPAGRIKEKAKIYSFSNDSK